MKSLKTGALFHWHRSEILFFIFFFLIFPIVTDFEYTIYERTGTYPSYELITERIIYGILQMIPFYMYYKIVVPYLFERRYLVFLLCLVLFLIFLDIYKIYFQYWLISKLVFLPEKMVLLAKKWSGSKAMLFHFSIIYTLRELLMVTALAYFIHSSKQEKLLNKLRQQHLQTELKYLKTQLQPHFFFNTLNNIYSLTLEKSDRAAPLIARYAEMMRHILYQSQNQTVALHTEVEFLRNYVAAEALRYDDQTDVSFDTQGITGSVTIEPLLLLPFIENAFKHGLAGEVTPGFVHVVVCLIGNELSLEVRNSKSPPENSKRNDSGGIGLENAISRLQLLYPDYDLVISDSLNQYEIHLNLTLTAKHGYLSCRG